MSSSNPVPDGVETELTRVVRRWQQLPLDHASLALPVVQTMLAELAPLGGHDVGGSGGIPAGEAVGSLRVPDLGPAVVMDQLRVLVYDACEAGHAEGVTARLAALRRTLP